MLSQEKILLTGATGFIGEHIAAHLHQEGLNVTLLVRDKSRLHPTLQKMPTIVADLMNTESLKTLKDFSIVIHAAGRTGKGHIEDPLNDFNQNAIGAINLFQACAQMKVKKLINFSSYEVYGEPKSLPVKESDAICPPTPYAISVLSREIYTSFYSKMHGIKTVSLRLFNVYGKPLSDRNKKGVVPFVIDQAKKGDVTIAGHPDFSRDFVHVKDVARIVRSLLDQDVGSDEVLNVGTGVATSLKELTDLVQKVVGKPLKVSFQYEKTNSQKNIIYANIQLLKNRLKFNHNFDLETGIREILS